MKSAKIWLLIAWRGWKSSWNSASSAAHLAILPVALELCRIALKRSLQQLGVLESSGAVSWTQ